MALTTQEKQDLRVYICKKHRPMITPQVLSDYAAKTEDEIRALLAVYKQEELAKAQAAKVAIDAKIAELGG